MTISEYAAYHTASKESLASNAQVHIKKREAREFKAGGAWIYDNEIDHISGDFQNGDIVSVLDFDGFFLGYGFLNTNSTIRVRMLSRKKENVISPAFLKARVKAAWDYRKAVIDTSSCRVIFGEADFLPGLTVDKYEDVLVVESLALGIEKLKTLLLASLVQVLQEDGIRIRGIYERSDAKVREKEGLARTSGFLSEEFDTNVAITENGVRYIVDVRDGQKTGFFLDQKENRKSIWPICRGKDVLDCFTHTGSFALNAARGGAEHVTAVDISQSAIDMARANAVRNGLEGRMDFLTADVFDLLTELEKKGGKPYDFIILDPPAFTKSRKTVKSAERGYKDINLRALRLLPRGGYLATCSCSHFMRDDLFRRMLREAAKDAGVHLRQIEGRQQSPDHPILWNVPETDYLKFYLFQVV